MTNDALPTYLQDHLAGALHAIELLRAMRNHFSEEPLGQFADQMLAEVEADREVLARLTERLGGTPGGMKEWGAWLVEKVSRLKLKHGSNDGLGTFEALEFLVIGIHGNGLSGGQCRRFRHSTRICGASISVNWLRAPTSNIKW